MNKTETKSVVFANSMQFILQNQFRKFVSTLMALQVEHLRKMFLMEDGGDTNNVPIKDTCYLWLPSPMVVPVADDWPKLEVYALFFYLYFTKT